MRIFFDTNELASLRDRAGHAGFDVAGIGAELAAAAGAVAIRELASFRIGNAARLATDVGAVSGGLGLVAARLEGDAGVAQLQIGKAWWSQNSDTVSAGNDIIRHGLRFAKGAVKVAGEAHWLGRVASLASRGKLWEASRRWRFGGYYDVHLGRAFSGVATSLGAAASLAGLRGIGKVTELGGKFADAAYVGAKAAKAIKFGTKFGTKALKVSKLGVLSTAVSAYSVIAGSDRKNFVASQQSANSADRLRGKFAYGAQIASVGGSALMMVPFPPVQLAGAVIVGVSTVVEGVTWLSSSANRAALASDVKKVGSAVGSGAKAVGSGAKKAFKFLTPF